jgi:hypothetical protein
MSEQKTKLKVQLQPILRFLRPKFANEDWNLQCEATFPECHACELIMKCPNWKKVELRLCVFVL